jgi:hypothetical protein
VTAVEHLAIPPELNVIVERYVVYRCYGEDGHLLYVGETGDLGKRLARHAKTLWFTQVRGITLEWYADEVDALNAERRAIHVEHPKYNKQHRQKTHAQAARPAPRGRRRTAPRRPATASGDKGASKQRALDILAAEPDITGSELGRRLGLTDTRGRQIMREISKRSFRVLDGEEQTG